MNSLVENIPLVQTTSKGRYYDKVKRTQVSFEIAGQRILTIGELNRLRKGRFWLSTVINRPAALRLLRGGHAVGILYDGAYAEADKAEERSLSIEGLAARTERLKAIITTLNQQFADFDKSRAIATEHNMDLADVSNVIREISLGEHLSVDQLSWLTSQEAGPLRTMLVMTLPDQLIVDKVLALAPNLPPAVEEICATPALPPAVEEGPLSVWNGPPAYSDTELKVFSDTHTFIANARAKMISNLPANGEGIEELVSPPPGFEPVDWYRLLSTYFIKHMDKMVPC